MVAPQSRTLVRYRNMIARQPPTLLGCAPALRTNRGTGACSRRPLAVNRRREQGDGAVFAMTLRVSKCSRANAPCMLGEGVVSLFSFPLNT